jgi:hypothetical protein
MPAHEEDASVEEGSVAQKVISTLPVIVR